MPSVGVSLALSFLPSAAVQDTHVLAVWNGRPEEQLVSSSPRHLKDSYALVPTLYSTITESRRFSMSSSLATG